MSESHDPVAGFDVAALMAPSLRRLGWLAVVIAYLWALPDMATARPFPHWAGLLGPSALLLAGLVSVRGSSSYRASALTLAAGLIAAFGLELAVGHAPGASTMALAAVLVSGVFLGAPFGIALACLLCLGAGLAYFAWPGSLPLSLIVPAWREAALGGLLLWALGGSIFRALRLAEASELRSWRQAREAMASRADVQRTSKALRDMYALLERTNRELEIARREADDAREVKARFAANISHELRTPLNLILGFSRMMYQTPEVYGPVTWPAEFRLDIHEIYRASRHLLGMIDDILDLSRIQAQRLPLKPTLTQLGSIVEEAVATARGLLRGSGVTLSVDVPQDLPPLEVDATRIRQVLLNLLSNAIRFTDAGEIRVSARLLAGELEVSVADTGLGIAPADLAAIFDVFTQAGGPGSTNRGGAGLGLAVCKHFVELHGGRISAESTVGVGSTFRFVLPLPDSGRARSHLSYYAPEGWLAPLPLDRLGPSLLVLSPDAATAQMVARGLTGFRALPLTEGELCPDLVEAEHPSALVVTRDPLHPRGGASVEALWQTAGRGDLPVIECELPTETAAQQSLAVAAYLTKPVQTEELLAAIRAALPMAAGALAQVAPAPGPDASARGQDASARGQDDAPDAPSVLIVDDASGFRTLMRRELLRAYPEAAIEQCASGEEGLALLRRQRFDVLLLDLVMADGGGIELLRQAREAGMLGSTGVIVVSGAPYIEELTALFPTRLSFSKRTPPRSRDWFRCIEALAGAAPPDYTAQRL